MNPLFTYAGAKDLPSSPHHLTVEFWRLDKEIEKMNSSMSLKELFHSLEFALMNVRAKEIIKSLNQL